MYTNYDFIGITHKNHNPYKQNYYENMMYSSKQYNYLCLPYVIIQLPRMLFNNTDSSSYSICWYVTMTFLHIQYYVDMLPWHSFIFSIVLICYHDIPSYSVLCWYVTMIFLSHSKLSIYNTKSAGPINYSQLGPALKNPHSGVIKSRLFKYTQQHTTGFTENN